MTTTVANVNVSKRLRMIRNEFSGGLDRNSVCTAMLTDSSLEWTGVKGGEEVHMEPDIHCTGLDIKGRKKPK